MFFDRAFSCFGCFGCFVFGGGVGVSVSVGINIVVDGITFQFA